MPHNSLTSFEIQKHYQNELKFSGVYSRNNLPNIKDRAYVINRDKYKSIGTNWIGLYVKSNNISNILAALELSIFQKKLKNSSATRIS